MTKFLDHYRHSYKEVDDVVWGVELSNGEICYQNPDEETPSWWYLKKYLKDNNLIIIRMWVQFRENQQHLPSNCQGYYYAKGAIGSPVSVTEEYYVMGYLGGDTIYKNWYIKPALVLRENYIETVDYDNPPLGLIINGKEQNRKVLLSV